MKIMVQETNFDLAPWGVRESFTIDLGTARRQQVAMPTNVEEVRPLALLRTKAEIKSPIVAYANQDLKLTVERNGRQTILTPNGADEDYIWASLSPDRTKIVYFVMSLGSTFVCDLNGRVLANLGSNFHAPQWLNNDWVIGMDDKDDGKVHTASHIVAVTADGKVRQNLTQPGGSLDMYPTASPDGKKIAFHTTAGELYIMEVIVK